MLNDADEAPKGVTVKTCLQAYYDDEVNHGRLYPNLNELIAARLASKGTKDKRTNAYDVADAGRDALKSELAWLVERVDGFPGTDA